MVKKLKKLEQIITDYGKVVVAFSGGVDSTFLLEASRRALGIDGVLAVTAISASYPMREMKVALEIASQLEVKLKTVHTSELELENYARNFTDRCYFCKTELFHKLKPIAEKYGTRHVIYGAITDDLGDERPGMEAARKMGIDAPLIEANLSKGEIRKISREWNLPTWNKPAFACLSSRLPHGERVTTEKLAQIDRAEQFLYELGFRQFRVRHHGNFARIELEANEIEFAGEKKIRMAIDRKLKSFGYEFVGLDLQGYKQGNLIK